jgi:F-type H+-transporting ATPase subunit b
MGALAELFQEVVREVTRTEFLVEFVQGCLLVAILVFVVPRLLRPRIAARAERVKAELESAETAEDERAKSQREARRIVSIARRESRAAAEQACAEAEAKRAEALAAAEQEAADIVATARRTVEAEKAAVVSQACDETVALVTVIARRYLEEALSEGERRKLTEKLVLSSLESMDKLEVE